MNPTLLSVMAVAAAYLIGSIPFGYLIGRWWKGVDVRTVGSGNIGATNVGRLFGFRYFLLVFALDLSKGLLPTLGFPRIVAENAGQAVTPALPVLVGLATILGHNYPLYLGFKGGKGVATSLGALTALDPWASLAAALGFLGSLAINRYVSISSLVGGIAFVATHFARTEAPWSGDEIAMSLVTVALLAMLFYRHRANLGRVRAGTEPRVKLRRRPPTSSPSGRISVGWVVGLAALSGIGLGAYVFLEQATRPQVLRVGRYAIREVAHASTGHQRAERLAFADDGNLLVVTCPRYRRVMIYRVDEREELVPLRDLEMAGVPVAVWPTRDRLLILSRPPGDNRHIEPGWLETFDFQGDALGDRVRVGFYPDDLAASPDGRYVYVLTSGRAEGEPNRPSPALEVFEFPNEANQAEPLGRVTFEEAGDDPERLTLSSSGKAAAVTLLGSNAVAAVWLENPTEPRLLGRSRLPDLDLPYPSRFGEDRIVMPVASGSEGALVPLAGFGECVAATLPRDSGLELYFPSRRRSLGRLTLRSGSIGLSRIRPMGVAYAPQRGLIAVSNRSGSVHLVAIRAGVEALATRDSR
ncbi:MAG: glycerol-3-phosphate 1-O-acyltransferase PlsY [Isosphaeraceae bacterium]